MTLIALLLLVVGTVLIVVSLRAWRRHQERETWASLSVRYPVSDGAFPGERFPYPDEHGELIVNDEGFRAQPSVHLAPIEVRWADVRSVRSGIQGGLLARVHGGAVLLPGAASPAVARIIEERARARTEPSAPEPVASAG